MIAGICNCQQDSFVGDCKAYLFCQIVQLLPTIVDELVNENDLFSINGRLLQLAH
jgi:hypothetical protein